MLSRRRFAASLPLLGEAAFAQRATLPAEIPKGAVYLNANENPEGPPHNAMELMTRSLADTGRYHYEEFPFFYEDVAASEGLDASQVVVGAGSSEVLHNAVDAFTGPSRPLITMEPTYELPAAIARAHGRPVIAVPLTKGYGADVRRMAEAARQAGGGLIYICNPNNPTSSLTLRSDISWLVVNLPPNTVALIDEAYLHYAQGPDAVSAVHWVRLGRSVIVTRTFSKIYGMAGLRVGFGCARPDLIEKLAAFRSNVISVVGMRAARGALGQAPSLIPQRRAKLVETRSALTAWLKLKGFGFIEPQASFVMIETGRDTAPLIANMAKNGVVVGRQFPPLTTMLRVSIGTGEEMARFRDVFLKAVNTAP